jgi:hypothetical protein
MHGAQDGGLGVQREMLELAPVRVIRVADAAGARQPFNEKPKLGWESLVS